VTVARWRPRRPTPPPTGPVLLLGAPEPAQAPREAVRAYWAGRAMDAMAATRIPTRVILDAYLDAVLA
jgi:hypothetical protein